MGTFGKCLEVFWFAALPPYLASHVVCSDGCQVASWADTVCRLTAKNSQWRRQSVILIEAKDRRSWETGTKSDAGDTIGDLPGVRLHAGFFAAEADGLGTSNVGNRCRREVDYGED